MDIMSDAYRPVYYLGRFLYFKIVEAIQNSEAEYFEEYND